MDLQKHELPTFAYTIMIYSFFIKLPIVDGVIASDRLEQLFKSWILNIYFKLFIAYTPARIPWKLYLTIVFEWG